MIDLKGDASLTLRPIRNPAGLAYPPLDPAVWAATGHGDLLLALLRQRRIAGLRIRAVLR
jgi:hypothetical protein